MYLTSGKQVDNFPSNQFDVASTYGEGNTMVYKGKTRVCNNIVIVSASCVLRNCITYKHPIIDASERKDNSKNTKCNALRRPEAIAIAKKRYSALIFS